MISWVFAYVQTHHIVNIRYVQSLYMLIILQLSCQKILSLTHNKEMHIKTIIDTISTYQWQKKVWLILWWFENITTNSFAIPPLQERERDLPHSVGWTSDSLLMNENNWHDGLWLLRLDHGAHVWHHCFLTCSGKANCYVMKTLKESYGEVNTARNWGICQQSARKWGFLLTVMWARCCGSGSPSPK